MIEISEPKSAESLADLRRDYLASLSAPLDGMWEAFAMLGRPREIRRGGEPAGYFVLDEAGQLLQFHVTPDHEIAARDIFAAVLARDEVTGAVAGTNDALFLGLCLDAQRSLRVQTLLYADHRSAEVPFEHGDSATLDAVEAGELDAVAELLQDSLDDAPGDWLRGYLGKLIDRLELFALRLDGEIIGTGEARVSDSQPPYVDLGVVTLRRHRGCGVATHVLGRLKRACYERDLVPICSTTVENVAARRAIEKAGFVSRHRLLEIGF